MDKMDDPTEVNMKEDLQNIVEECLETGETNKAIDALKNPKYASCIERNAWDIFPKIVQRLSDTNKKISTGAQELLMALVSLANPEEMLLELIEKAENSKQDSCFVALLPPMQATLTRMPEKRGTSLQWCLNTISQHVSSTRSEDSETEEESDEETEDNSTKLDKQTKRAVEIYRAALNFCHPFIKEVSLHNPDKSFDKPVLAQRDRQRVVLGTFILQALAQFGSVDLRSKKTKNVCRLLAEDLVHALSHICSDFLYFLTYMFERSKTSQKLKKSNIEQNWEDANPFLFEDVVPIAGLGTFYYLVLVEGIKEEYTPKVYSTFFVFENMFHVVIGLLSRGTTNAVFKGLQIAEILLKHLGRLPLPPDVLENPIHSKFCTTLLEILFRSDVPTARLAGTVFKTYLKSFSHQGLYNVLKHLFSYLDTNEPREVTQNGPKGFLVTLLKDAIDRSLKEFANEDDVIVFRNASLMNLITCFCSLRNIDGNDIAPHADHILACLNLLWYLVLVKDTEKLGIIRFIQWFEDDFLEAVHDAACRTRADYEQRKGELLKRKDTGENDELQDVESTLNKLILIDSLLTEVDKAMSNNWRNYEDGGSNRQESD